MGGVLNLSAYKFVDLDDVADLRRELWDLCKALDLKGSILLSREGINLFVAGPPQACAELMSCLRSKPAFSDLSVKESVSTHQPFTRMLVKLKREIIAFGVPGIEPAKSSCPKIAPAELKKWLDEQRDFVLLDTRNNYEVSLGT